MLALVMCLLVLGVSSAVVLRTGLREETDKRATTPPPARRARPHRRGPVRSGLLLGLSTVGIGVATGLGVGLLLAALALALRSSVGAQP